MRTDGGSIKAASFRKRVVIPVAAILCVWGISTLIYNHAWRFLDPSLHRPLAIVSAILMAAAISGGTFIIYPVAFFRGASPRERGLACLVTPIVWNVKEMLVFPDFYSFGERLYYGFTPLFLGVLASTIFQMGLSESACRLYLRRKKGTAVGPVFGIAPVSLMLGGMLSLYGFSIWDEGVGFWYIYQGLYQALFLS
ncbi:MAG: hypothetical protein ABIK68_13075 [bacterium]